MSGAQGPSTPRGKVVYFVIPEGGNYLKPLGGIYHSTMQDAMRAAKNRASGGGRAGVVCRATIQVLADVWWEDNTEAIRVIEHPANPS